MIKEIKAEIILNNDVLSLSNNKIELHLYRQIMRVKNSTILLYFISFNAALSFYTYALKSCFKFDVNDSKKKIRFQEDQSIISK